MAFHSFMAKVVSRKELTKDVVILSFSCPEDFTFKSGQFVSIRIPKGDEIKTRSYSILNPPSKRVVIDLCIKIVENGYASEIWQNAKIGDEFNFKGALGHFVFEKEDDHSEYWFLGAGTGVAPLYSMIKEHVGLMPDKKFVLLFGVRYKESLFLHEEFVQLAKEHTNFTYMPTLSREDWEGKSGHVQKHLPDDCKDKTFYICGLKELVEEATDILIAKGADKNAVKSERYS